MYFLPEEEIGSHQVSERLNQNIKLMREFNDSRCGHEYFMKFGSEMVLYSLYDYDDNIKISSCKIDSSGVFQFFESAGLDIEPLELIFDSVPIVGFYTTDKDEGLVTFSFTKIPGILSREIQVDGTYLDSYFHKNIKVFSASSYVGLFYNRFHHPLQENDIIHSSNETIRDKNKRIGNHYCKLILFELQLEAPDKYKLVEISSNNLKLFTGEAFDVKDMILNKIEGIMLIQVTKYQDVILLLYNIKSGNIESSITVFENIPRSEYGQLTNVFFVNLINFEGGIIVAVSRIVKQIKVFSKCGKKDYRLLFWEPLIIDDVQHSQDYDAYCVSNRNNQIVFVIVQRNRATFYDLFDMSNNTFIYIKDGCGRCGLPQLYSNESGEEFYLKSNHGKIYVYLYRSMFKSLAYHAALIVTKTYTKSQLIEMRLPEQLYKYMKLVW